MLETNRGGDPLSSSDLGARHRRTRERNRRCLGSQCLEGDGGDQGGIDPARERHHRSTPAADPGDDLVDRAQ